jgi:hypothetical protein
MKMSKNTKLTLVVLLFLTLSVLINSLTFIEAYTGQKIAEYMSSPLPSAPEPVLQGGDFPVSVKDLSSDLAGGEASAWSGVITSIYGSYNVPLVNGSFDGEKWLLYFNVPSESHVGLYNLTLTQGTRDVHQSNCVWVLEKWPDTITFSHCTDLHEPIGELVYPAYIMQTNFINPDFMIATGDLVQTESNARAWAYLQYNMMQQEYPSFFLPGNHDYSGYAGRAYAQYGGKLNYTVELGDFIFIASDTGRHGYFEEDQIKWLESELSKYPDKVKIIGFHHAFLSSEYEEDLGTVTGGYIEADWENIDEIAPLMFFTWIEDGLPKLVAREFLRIVQEYDVRIILTGHVHRDMIYVLNENHYFITTSTTGGGLPPGERFGSRIITLDKDGTVYLDPYTKANLDNPPNNIPTGKVTYTYSSANDFTGTAVSASVRNDLEMPIEEGKLVFKVSDSKPLDEYEFLGEQPERVETTTTAEGYIFDTYFDVPEKTSFEITLKAEDDSTEPSISVMLAESYQIETPTIVTLTASDYGWGLKTIDVSYSIDDGYTWIPVNASITPILTGELFKDNFADYELNFKVPALFEGESIIIKAEATDYAGNTASLQSEDLTVEIPTEYTLGVNSEPVPVDITLNGVSLSTPYEATLEEGEYSVSVPSSVTFEGNTYELKEWSTGETTTEITLTLSEDSDITITYELQVTEEIEPETETDNGGGIPLPASYMLIGVILAVTIINLGKKK